MLTAGEFIIKNSYFILATDTELGNELKRCMVEFAKYHVEQALQEASEKAELDLFSNYTKCEISKSSILEAYSLENIK